VVSNHTSRSGGLQFGDSSDWECSQFSRLKYGALKTAHTVLLNPCLLIFMIIFHFIQCCINYTVDKVLLNTLRKKQIGCRLGTQLPCFENIFIVTSTLRNGKVFTDTVNWCFMFSYTICQKIYRAVK
jgi:hypothetical protein